MEERLTPILDDNGNYIVVLAKYQWDEIVYCCQSIQRNRERNRKKTGESNQPLRRITLDFSPTPIIPPKFNAPNQYVIPPIPIIPKTKLAISPPLPKCIPSTLHTGISV